MGKISLTVVLLIMITLLAFSGATAQEGQIKILSEPPAIDIKDYKPFDILVYRVMGDSSRKDKSYTVAYFPIENDSVKFYTAGFSTAALFDSALYKWVNESSVTVKLHNSQENSSMFTLVFGRGSPGVLPNINDSIWNAPGFIYHLDSLVKSIAE